MIVRLVKTSENQFQLLCADGTICNPTESILVKLLTEFKEAHTISGKDGNWKNSIPDISLYPGETVAIVTDSKQLLICDFAPFYDLLSYSDIKYISTQEYAAKHNKSTEIVKVFCRQKRIVGAKKIGHTWVIPEDAPYPVPPEYQRDSNPSAGRPSKISK